QTCALPIFRRPARPSRPRCCAPIRSGRAVAPSAARSSGSRRPGRHHAPPRATAPRLYPPTVPISSIVAIGDELVGGFTLDTNSHWMAERLRLLGYPVKRVTQIRDKPQEIVDQIHRELADPDVTDVFLTGGLGPTPDDRTFAALASALGKELVIWEETRARIERRVQRMHAMGLLESPEVTEGNLRMARIAASPSHLFRNRPGMAPGVVYEQDGHRLFVLPGVPMELKGIFTEELEPEYLSDAPGAIVRELRFTFAIEARFYPPLGAPGGT